MLGIILTILKFIGTGLGIVLLIAFGLLLLALLVPVRYTFDGKNQDTVQASGNVYWLFHIVSFRVTYENEKMHRVLRIFGVPVWRK